MRLFRRPPADPEDDLAGLSKAIIERLRRDLGTGCPFCGGLHGGLCRRVSLVEYWPDTGEQGLAGVKVARLRETWDESRTIYPEQLDEWERRLREAGQW